MRDSGAEAKAGIESSAPQQLGLAGAGEPESGGPLWLPALLGVLVTVLMVALLFGLAFLKAGLF